MKHTPIVYLIIKQYKTLFAMCCVCLWTFKIDFEVIWVMWKPSFSETPNLRQGPYSSDFTDVPAGMKGMKSCQCALSCKSMGIDLDISKKSKVWHLTISSLISYNNILDRDTFPFNSHLTLCLKPYHRLEPN